MELTAAFLAIHLNGSHFREALPFEGKILPDKEEVFLLDICPLNENDQTFLRSICFLSCPLSSVLILQSFVMFYQNNVSKLEKGSLFL